MVVLTVFVHHGGFLNEENWTYVGGIVEKVGRVNTDYLTVPDLNVVVQGCGYMTSGLMFCTLDDEEPNHMRPLQRDADVITIIEIVEANQNKSLHIYVKHNVDVPDIVMDSDANGDAVRENEVNVSDAEAAGSGDNNTGINDFANAQVLSDFSGEAGASHEGDEITNGAQPQRIRRTTRRRVGDGIAANVMSQTTEQHVKQPMVAPEGDQTEGVGHRQAIPEIRRRGRSNVVERAAKWAEMMRATQ